MESCQELSQFEKNLFLHNKGFYEHIHIFNLHILTIQDQKDDYYQYLEYKATPYFNKIDMQQVTEHYQIQLFDYYMENQEMNKANSLAKSIIDNYRKNIQFLLDEILSLNNFRNGSVPNGFAALLILIFI
jgi:hypothetical protein